MKTTMFLALTFAAGTAFAQPASAPAPPVPVDSRLAGWLGCWRLDDDLAGTGARMCITPERNGVRLQTLFGSAKGIDEVVVPNGVSRPVSDGDCSGTERAEFSADNLRVFRTTQVTCGKEAPRTITSVAFLAAGPSWINVQHVSGEHAISAVRVERYRRAANQQLADGSRAPQAPASLATAESGRWSIDDVVEASGRLPAEAVQAALAELKYGFDLNKKTLLALDKAGVRGDVIDLMVALSYPQKFVVERRTGGGSLPMGISTGTGWFDPFLAPMVMGTYADCYSPFGYGYRTYYSMCGMYSPFYSGYSGYDRYSPYGYQLGSYSWVGLYPPVGSINTNNTGEAPPDGRVVRGVGFTQIRNREPEPAPRVSGTGGNGGAWSGAGNGGVSSGAGFSGGSPSSGSSGGSSGGSSDSGARVAVPKGGGGAF